jgi:putative ABC transport system permease protein
MTASLIGVMGAVRRAMRLPPAEAMRPEPPVEFKPSVLERMGVHRLVGSSTAHDGAAVKPRPSA